jgi:hypothetical protein
MNRKLFAGLLFSSALFGCGDLGNVDVSLTFSDSAMQAATRRLLFIVREVPKSGTGCEALWTMQSNGLAESRSVIDYPNRNDVVAAPVKLSQYPRLTLLVYAYPNKDTVTTSPIGAGCQLVTVSADSTMNVMIKLDPPPAK